MIATEHLTELDEKLYFKSRYIPGTFCYDLTDKTTKFLFESSNGNSDFRESDYWYAVRYKDYIIYPPFLADKFIM